MGHEFELVIQVTNPAECQLRWYEKTNVPYIEEVRQRIGNHSIIVRPGMRPNTWNNMYVLEEESKIFSPWNQVQNRQGLTVIRIVDIPATEVPEKGAKERYLDFRIIVEGSDGSERVAEASQRLGSRDGLPRTSSFTIRTNNRIVSAGGFVGRQAPQYV